MIEAYFTDNVTWRRITRDAFGRETPNDAPISCRVERKEKWIRREGGEVKVSTHQVLVSASNKPATHDKIIIDGVSFAIGEIVELKDWITQAWEVRLL